MHHFSIICPKSINATPNSKHWVRRSIQKFTKPCLFTELTIIIQTTKLVRLRSFTMLRKFKDALVCFNLHSPPLTIEKTSSIFHPASSVRYSLDDVNMSYYGWGLACSWFFFHFGPSTKLNACSIFTFSSKENYSSLFLRTNHGMIFFQQVNNYIAIIESNIALTFTLKFDIFHCSLISRNWFPLCIIGTQI